MCVLKDSRKPSRQMQELDRGARQAAAPTKAEATRESPMTKGPTVPKLGSPKATAMTADTRMKVVISSHVNAWPGATVSAGANPPRAVFGSPITTPGTIRAWTPAPPLNGSAADIPSTKEVSLRLAWLYLSTKTSPGSCSELRLGLVVGWHKTYSLTPKT